MAFSLPRPLQHRLQQRREEDLEGGPKARQGPTRIVFGSGFHGFLRAKKKRQLIDRRNVLLKKIALFKGFELTFQI